MLEKWKKRKRIKKENWNKEKKKIVFDVYRKENHNRKQRGTLYGFHLQQKKYTLNSHSQLQFSSFHTFHLSRTPKLTTFLCMCICVSSALFCLLLVPLGYTNAGPFFMHFNVFYGRLAIVCVYVCTTMV